MDTSCWELPGTARGMRLLACDPDSVSTMIGSACSDDTFSQVIRPEIWTQEIHGRCVVAVFVPEAMPGAKPIYLRRMGLPRGAYRRIGSSDQQGTADDLDRYQEAKQNRPYEDTIVADATLDDLDAEVLRGYRQSLIDANPATELRDYTADQLIEALGGCRRDDEGTVRPTIAGLLLFGRRASLRRLMPSVRVDYLRVEGTEWVPSSERPFSSIEVRAPLLEAFRRVYQSILDDLPSVATVTADDPRRQDQPTVPSRVLREALVNALTHRNYRVHQPIQVIRYRNRIEIRNPGHSLVEEDQLGQPGSQTRNPRIADVFREMGLAENKGTGIAVMRREMKAAHLSPPVFESDRRNDIFRGVFLFHHLLDDADREWLARFSAYDLSDHQAIALVYARDNKEVRNSTLRDLTGLDTLAASMQLRKLRDLGLLELHGSSVASYYSLGPAARNPQTPPGEAAESGQGVLPWGSRGVEPETQGLEPKTQGLEPKTQGLEPETQGSPPTEGDLRNALPDELLARIDTLGRRPRPAELQALIIDMCRVRAFTPGELAALLGRKNVNHLVRKHLRPLTEAGRLTRRYPETPAHPQQAYRAATDAD